MSNDVIRLKGKKKRIFIDKVKEILPDEGNLGSCDMALRNDSCNAMGASPEDFTFVVEDVLEEYQEAQPEFAKMHAPIDKQGAYFFLNQNSREPVTEPDEMVPLWKILHVVGADWTYGSKGWGAKIIACSRPKMKPGSTLRARPPNRPMISAVKFT